MNVFNIFKKHKKKIIIIFVITIILIIVTIVIVLVVKNNDDSKPPTCTKNQTLTKCNGKQICVDKCTVKGTSKCDPCDNSCYDLTKNKCINGKPCPNMSACSNGTKCCTSPKVCTIDNECIDCTSGNFCTDGSGKVSCCEGKQTCWGEQCCDPGSHKKTSSGKEVCCTDDLLPDGTCCDPSKIYDNKCCLDGNICYDAITKKKSCCHSPAGCKDTNYCITKGGPVLKGTCLVDNSSTTAKGCVKTTKYIDSSFSVCKTNTDCKSGEICQDVSYKKINGVTCTDSSQCTGIGSNSKTVQCYNTDSTGNTKGNPVPCTGDKGQIQIGKCSNQCGDSADKNSIWCPIDESCIHDSSIGTYCSPSKSCYASTITYDPPLIQDNKKKTHPICKQMYQNSTDKCTYYIPGDTTPLKTFTTTAHIDKVNGSNWCPFNDKSPQGVFGSIIETDIQTEFPIQIAGNYSGYGTSNQTQFLGGDKLLPDISITHDFDTTVSHPIHITNGNPTNGIKSSLTSTTTLTGKNGVKLSDSCNIADCYNKINEQGISHINYNDDSGLCEGTFSCTSDTESNPKLPSTNHISPGDFTNFPYRSCQSKQTNWNGMICPNPADSCILYDLEGTLNGEPLPPNHNIYTCTGS